MAPRYSLVRTALPYVALVCAGFLALRWSIRRNPAANEWPGATDCSHRCPEDQKDKDGCCMILEFSTDAVALPSPSPDKGMVRIPAGRFMMGSEDGVHEDQPIHAVEVAAFLLDVTEVTVAAYADCVKDWGCTAAATAENFPAISEDDKKEGAALCNANKSDKQDHPINCVDVAQAKQYCAWVGKRLPTEEEWEYAARGTEGRTYPWGAAPPSDKPCWNRYRTKEGTCAVGSHPSDKSPFGVLDMAGNVTEWTASDYSMSYDEPRRPGRPILRGGSWSASDASELRGALRDSWGAAVRYKTVGFRCAR